MQALNSTAASVAHSGLTGLHHHPHAAAAQHLSHPHMAGTLQPSAAAMNMLTLQQLMAAGAQQQQAVSSLSNGLTGKLPLPIEKYYHF